MIGLLRVLKNWRQPAFVADEGHARHVLLVPCAHAYLFKKGTLPGGPSAAPSGSLSHYYVDRFSAARRRERTLHDNTHALSVGRHGGRGEREGNTRDVSAKHGRIMCGVRRQDVLQ